MNKFIRQNFACASSLETLMSRLFFFFSFFLFFGGGGVGWGPHSQSVSQAENQALPLRVFPAEHNSAN